MKKKPVVNFWGAPDRKGEDGLWLRSWCETNESQQVVYHSRLGGLWHAMTARCKDGGSEQRTRPRYTGITCGFVDFNEFASWAVVQPGYLCLDEKGNAYHLDKDIIVPGSTTYSAATCCFLPARINSLFGSGSSRSRGGTLPLGVTYRKDAKKFQARCSNGRGKNISLGFFDDPSSAHDAWKKAKAEVVRKLAADYSMSAGFDARVVVSLMARASAIEVAP